MRTRSIGFRRGLLLAAPSLAFVFQAFSAFGQSASENPAITAAGDAGLEEVVVTAEKRESTVQKTPISMTALSGADLQAAGASSLADAAKEVPGLTMRSGGPGQTEFELRGLNSAGGEAPTVGFYLDEAPLSAFAYATAGKVVIDPDLYDLNRIEVLRGPQGTLYGSGSMGGTIKLITNQPVLNEFQAAAQAVGSATQGSGANYGGSLMVNGPLISDLAALRVVATAKENTGWIDRTVLNPFPLPTNDGSTRGDVLSAPVQQRFEDVNWEQVLGVRASILIQPNDALSILPMVMWQRIQQGGETLIDNPPGTREAFFQPFDVAEPFADTFHLYTMTVKYDFSTLQITSATSKWTRQTTQTQDGSEIMQSVFAEPSFYVQQGGLGRSPWTEIDAANQFSQELRVGTTDTSRFQWLVGAFFSDFNSLNDQTGLAPDGGVSQLGLSLLYHQHIPQNIKQTAIFGEASYDLTDTLRATAGVRWYTYDSHFATAENGFFASGSYAYNYSYATTSQSGTNPKLNFSYTPNSALMLYTTAAKGFRPGGGNEAVPDSGPPGSEGAACEAQLATFYPNAAGGTVAAPTVYDPDTVWSYELGEKAKLFDSRVIINSAVYHEHWQNVQRSVTLSCGYIYTDNAGAADINGAELEIQAKLTPEWTLRQSVGYTHSAYAQNSIKAQVTKGEELPDVREVVSSTALLYSHPLTPGVALNGRVSYDYFGPMTDITAQVNRLPGYDLVALRLGVDTAHWSAFAFGNNLTNQHALLTDIGSEALNVPSINRVATNQPRTFGLELNYRF